MPDTKKKERVVLTPAERVAKLERELEAARAKAAAKDTKAADKLLERRATLVKQIDERQVKVDDIDEQLQLLGVDPDEAAPAPAEPVADDGIVLPE